MIALIDGDILVYKAGFTCEYQTYNLDGEVFRYKNDILNYLDSNFDTDISDRLKERIVKETVLQPLPYAWLIMDTMMDFIINRLDTKQYEVYLSGKDNFRDKVPYPVVYKGNRTQPKPTYYQAIRDYLIVKYNARVIDGMEADDILSIRQRESEGNSIICSIDKDLLQVPGKHYHLDKQTIMEINDIEAYRNLASQLLTGDSTDNIIGIAGIGPKTAEKILKNAQTSDEMYVIVEKEYEKFFKEKAAEMMVSNMMLLSMKTAR